VVRSKRSAPFTEGSSDQTKGEISPPAKLH